MAQRCPDCARCVTMIQKVEAILSRHESQLNVQASNIKKLAVAHEMLLAAQTTDKRIDFLQAALDKHSQPQPPTRSQHRSQRAESKEYDDILPE